MLTKTNLMIILASAAFFLAPACGAAELAVVPSEGTAARTEDIAEVKRRAIDKALRNAVAETLKSMLSKESLSAPDTVLQAITANPRSYVLNYKIRSEGWINHMELVPAAAGMEAATPGSGVELYHIWIDATVDRDGLRNAIGKYLAVGSDSGPLVINILDVADYPTYKALLAALGKIAVIKDISYNSFSSGRITLLARASGDAPFLAARIAREVPASFTVMEGAGQIIIRPSAGMAVQ